ncbi:deoxyguanosinetriphosphate triphosphohydrolase [Cupriavidus sp. D384]|uniref:deoxyguanosinetriphosphate triphosphohydrolase n=1 Tax=Cupriavidus sp. D384 TaxID=1538095 RepID=UPI0008306A84|nr:deoxyguanosinetriphosphate triphosphohydrolase [Cupriavidus sp. D384]
MDWTKLLSVKRLGRKAEAGGGEPVPRTEFTRDYDRIIFSSAFRRLQDKTQVFPLAKSDYIRTRLTHSLEVASVGRSLGMLAADVIHEKDKHLRDVVAAQDIGSIVSVACLAHDIGNPPFGHSGEDAIQEWFAKSEAGAKISGGKLSPSESADLTKFEGNAQGFRTVAALQYPGQYGGLQLTCAVLGAFTKYPRESSVDDCQSRGKSGAKFGFMQSEKALFEELADEVGLPRKHGQGLAWQRHPLAFLVEAADDICYHIMDIEDGFRAGVVTFEELRDLHRPWLTAAQLDRATSLGEHRRQAEFFRALTLNTLIFSMVAVFRDKYDAILNGMFDQELAAHLERAKEFEAFKTRAVKQVYCARPVVEVEACGFEVINGLLGAFSDAVEDKALRNDKPGPRARVLLNLMPGGEESVKDLSQYERAIRVTDFVSGMTDSYAVELYQRIRGISLP